MMTINPEKISELKELDDDGSDTVLKELIELYLDSTPPKLQKMTDYFTTGDLASVRKEAHSLRSSSLTLGAEVISQYASDIEYAKEDDSTRGIIESGILNAKNEFDKIKTELKKYL